MTDESTEYLHRSRKRLAATKYVFFAAVLLWPLGLFFHAWVSLLIFGALMTLWGVTTYIAFMHYWSLKKRLRDARQKQHQ